MELPVGILLRLDLRLGRSSSWCRRPAWGAGQNASTALRAYRRGTTVEYHGNLSNQTFLTVRTRIGRCISGCRSDRPGILRRSDRVQKTGMFRIHHFQ